MTKPSGEAFESDKFDHVESRLFQFLTKLLGVVHKSCREPMRTVIGISMLTLSKVSLDYPSEICVEEESSGESVEE